MSAGAVYADENQLLVQFSCALAPVINAAAAFPFGQPEAVLVQKVAERLTEKAGMLAQEVFLDETAARPDTAALSELTILKALVSIYVACHYEGIEQMKKQNAPAEPMPADPMARVWEMFEKRTAMMDMLAKYIVQERSGKTASAAPQTENAPSSPPPQRGHDASSPVQSQSMNVPPPATQPAQATPAKEQAPEEKEEKSENANPMSFFGGSKTTGDDDS